MEEQILRIKKYIKILDNNIVQEEIFDFNLSEFIDRALNYMNRRELPTQLERIIAKAIIQLYKKINDEDVNNGEVQKEISSISDNGQSITFSDKVKTYMINSNDDEIFYGFTSQLDKFVKAKVVGEVEYTKKLQESNS